MEDHYNEENRLLSNLKKALEAEFGVDYWAEALKADLKQDLVGLYKNYRKIAQTKKKENEKLELEKKRKI